jgi:outer membrane lipoprotein SlyB
MITNRKFKTIGVLCIAIFASGCAHRYEPIVDFKGRTDQEAYKADLGECRQFAERVSPVDSGVEAAVAGALLGALAGRVVGGRGNVGYGAKVGALTGSVGGTAAAANAQIDIIRRCLIGRGWAVLR